MPNDLTKNGLSVKLLNYLNVPVVQYAPIVPESVRSDDQRMVKYRISPAACFWPHKSSTAQGRPDLFVAL